MCVAIAKKIGVELPNIDLLKNCFLANPEGAGYAYCDHGIVVIRKGFMTFKDFAAEYDSLDKGYLKNCGMLLHFRIGTHGLRDNPKHTHPFPMTDDYGIMEQLNVKTKAAVVHNGILAGYGKSSYSKGSTDADDYSDTMEFIKEVLLPLEDLGNWSENKAIKKLFNKAASYSYANKFAILRSDGSIQTEGEFVEKDGVLYSNRSFETTVVSYGKGYYQGYGTGSYKGGMYWEDLDEDGWEWDQKHQKYVKTIGQTGKSGLIVTSEDINAPKDPLSKMDNIDSKELFLPSGEKFSLRAEITKYIKGFERQTFVMYDEMVNAAYSTVNKYENKGFALVTCPTKLAVLENPGKPEQDFEYVFNYPFTVNAVPTKHRPLIWMSADGSKSLVMYFDDKFSPWFIERSCSVAASYSADFECDWQGLQLAKVVFNKLKAEGKFKKGKKADQSQEVKADKVEKPIQGNKGSVIEPPANLPALTKEI